MSYSPLPRSGEEARGAQRAQREGGAAAGLVGDFDALAGAGEQHGVVADDIAAAHRGKADGGRLALAGHAFAAIHRAFRQIPAQRVATTSPMRSAVPEGASTLWR